MSQITAAAVDQLRKRTGMQMMKCKAALVEAGGDMEKAIEIIRKQNKDARIKFGEREAAEGRIAIFVDPDKRVGAILEMRCESAPTAKNELFIALANELAEHVALNGAPPTVDELLLQPFRGDVSKTLNDRIGEVVGLIRENMKPARFARFTGHLGGYVHHDGSVGAMVQVEGTGKPDAQLLREVCMHITASNPIAALREEVPADRIAKEKEIAQAQIQQDPKNANKPPQILEKIAEGKLKTWFAENILIDQPFVRDDSKTVGELLKGAGLKLVKFVRYKIGER